MITTCWALMVLAIGQPNLGVAREAFFKFPLDRMTRHSKAAKDDSINNSYSTASMIEQGGAMLYFPEGTADRMYIQKRLLTDDLSDNCYLLSCQSRRGNQIHYDWSVRLYKKGSGLRRYTGTLGQGWGVRGKLPASAIACLKVCKGFATYYKNGLGYSSYWFLFPDGTATARAYTARDNEAWGDQPFPITSEERAWIAKQGDETRKTPKRSNPHG